MFYAGKKSLLDMLIPMYQQNSKGRFVMRNLKALEGTPGFVLQNAALVCLLGTVLIISACGYHLKSSVGALPSGIQSLGIPTFSNITNQYKIEQLISSAVLNEFSLRTKVPIRSSGSGVDAVLLGEIRSMGSTPVTFGSESFGSAFLVTVQISAKLVRSQDSKVIWQNENFVYRERYRLNSNVKDFFSEENPALVRLSHEFAASLVSTILQR
jgi:hypothetical protein